MKPTLRSLALSLLALLPAFPAAGQVVDQLKSTILPPSGRSQIAGQLGTSAAIDGPYAVAGVPYHDTSSSDGGVVKVFDSVTGALLWTLVNPSTLTSPQFGTSVAISGNKIIVGAPYESTGASGAGSVYVYDLGGATPSVPLFTIHNPGPGSNENFGQSVSISGTRVVVGCTGDSFGSPGSGSTYIYELSGATPTVPAVILRNPTPSSFDDFGAAVGISGNRVVVSAPYDDTGAADSGSAYVFDLSSATPTVAVATLTNPSPAGSDNFGNSVAISGARVVVGAALDNTTATDSGSAYIYDITSATPNVPVATLVNPSPAANDKFGISVAISGNLVAVGAYLDDTGASNAGSGYVYDVTSATPTVPVAVLNNPGSSIGDWFGYSVALSGSGVVVGVPLDDTNAMNAGSAYVYDLAGATPTVPKIVLNSPGVPVNERYGYSVAVSGSVVVVGVPYVYDRTSNAGGVFVYDLTSATPGVPVLTLPNPNPNNIQNFGDAVAVSGTRIVVGVQNDSTDVAYAGRAYVYDLSSSTPTLPAVTLNNPSPAGSDYFGHSVGISGSRIVVGAFWKDAGATDSGSAYVFDVASATPTVPVTTLDNPSPAASDYFGIAVAIAGTYVVVGASNDDFGATNAGSAYLYDIGGSNPTVPIVTLHNPDLLQSGLFGTSVSMSGARVIVGATGNNGGAQNAGRAYIYDINSPTSTLPLWTLDNPAAAVSDAFGNSIAISGSRIVVGTYKDDFGTQDSGSAYLYDLDSATPTEPVTTLNNPTPAVGDWFGWWVSIDGTTVVVSAVSDDTSANNEGAVYVYGPSPYSLWKVSELGNQFASDLGDADRDGVSNLGEYGLLRSPTVPDGAATSVAPVPYAEGTRLRIFVPRDPARNDVTLEVQATGDLLGVWTTIATSALGAPFFGPGFFAGDSATPGVKSVEVRDTVNLPDAAQRFLRVRVRH